MKDAIKAEYKAIIHEWVKQNLGDPSWDIEALAGELTIHAREIAMIITDETDRNDLLHKAECMGVELTDGQLGRALRCYQDSEARCSLNHEALEYAIKEAMEGDK